VPCRHLIGSQILGITGEFKNMVWIRHLGSQILGITGELKKMVWIRHLENRKMYAPLFDSEIDDDEKLHRSFHKKKSKLCSIDGARAVEMKKVKMIFEDCYFHSRHFIKADLSRTDKEDPEWIKLGCVSN